MGILPFPFRRQIDAENGAQDWSQEEMADFYRAHRLLVENGAGIGIDRGITDIGEPWMVFFDGASQDVFLHVARIGNRCHLICDTLNLRLSAANISQLVAEFENSVRELLSIRAERTKNVVIHPAARIIMSISAIFLLFKLELGEAHAKTQHEKAEGESEVGSGRSTEKISASMARAQTAFSRVFESTDTPAHVALLAGAIIAVELSRFAAQAESKHSSEAETENPAIQQEVPAAVFEVSDHVIINAENFRQSESYTYKAERSEPGIYAAEKQGVGLDSQADSVPLKTNKNVKAITPSDKLERIEPKPPIIEPSDENVYVNTSIIEKAIIPTEDVSGVSRDNEATKALKEFIALAEGREVPSILDNFFDKEVSSAQSLLEISAGRLEAIDDKVGFFIKTNYDDKKLYELVSYFSNQMKHYDYDYVSGSVLIEEKDVEALAAKEIGLWTNVMLDGSTFSVIGHAGLIDDVATFFA